MAGMENKGIYLTIYITTEHGYGSGYDDNDYYAGMTTFLYGKLERLGTGLAYGRRIERLLEHWLRLFHCTNLG